MFVVGVLYCVQLFFDMMFLQNQFPLSFAIAFVSYLVQFSWHPLLDFYGVSMVLFYKSSMENLCNFYGVSKGVSMVVLCDSYEVSKGCMGFPLDSCGVSVVFL